MSTNTATTAAGEPVAGPVVTARSVTRTFGDFTAVDRVDLDVAPGEIVGLLGANGAGKTTMIKMLLGLLSPTSGRIALFGEAQRTDHRRRVGYVPQNLGLYPDLTASENLRFRAAVYASDTVDHDRSGAAGDQLVGDLPLGLQRRTAFAAAIQHRPDLLVLDEPTSGVSPLARSELWELMRREAERGAGVLVSTHYMDEAVQADRLVVMATRVVAAGTVADIVGDRTTLVVRTARWADAFTALDRAGFTVLLAGRALRVPVRGADRVRAATEALASAGIAAATSLEAATLDETMVELGS